MAQTRIREKASFGPANISNSEDLDALVQTAVKNVLHAAVVGSAKMTGGQRNCVYKVETAEGVFIAKIFKRGWPEGGKLSWIERQLNQFAVPHAKMTYASRDDAFFLHGFTISEYIEGQNALDAIASGNLSLETYYSKIGALLRRVHQIPARQYGYIGYGPGGMYPTFTEHKLTHEVRERLWEIEDTDLSAEVVYNRIEEKVRQQLAPFENCFNPVLIHADPVPKNAIWTVDQQLILIDWDEAIAGVWIADFAQLTYWHHYLNPFGEAKESTKDLVKDAFFRGYGAVEFSSEELAGMENALHIIYSVDLLPVYQREKNLKSFKQTKQRLMLLLEQS